MSQTDDSLLLGISAPIFRDAAGRLFIESQTISGLKAWRENFARVTAFSICRDAPPPAGWLDAAAEGIAAPDIAIVPLPDTYDLKTLLRQRGTLSGQMLQLMRETQYHTFAYGGWIGDPGEIAASVARKHGIPHAVWFDRVESQVVRAEAGKSLPARLKSALRAAIFTRNENRAVRSADLSLLHGATVFRHFSKIARNPHQVEDVHFTDGDRVDADVIAAKADAAAEGPLRILYCGRAAAMKGPLDWIRVLVGLKAQGVDFEAHWLGEGEMLAEMRAAAAEGGLTEADLRFEGFVSDPARVRDFYRRAHLLLFCHLSDESPRNLIESLHSATPLAGYRDPYSAELTGEQGAGLLVPRGDTDALVASLAALDADRARLSELIRRAGASAAHLTRDAVFRHRSDIIRSQLNQPHR